MRILLFAALAGLGGGTGGDTPPSSGGNVSFDYSATRPSRDGACQAAISGALREGAASVGQCRCDTVLAGSLARCTVSGLSSGPPSSWRPSVIAPGWDSDAPLPIVRN